MWATGKEDAGRLKTGGGQRGERMRTRGKASRKGGKRGEERGEKLRGRRASKCKVFKLPSSGEEGWHEVTGLYEYIKEES